MKKWIIVEAGLVAAIIFVCLLIKIQLTPMAQAREVAADEIYVQLADGRVLPYHQVKIVPIINQVPTPHETTKSRSKKLKPDSVKQQIRKLEPELADTLIRLAACESSLNPMAVGDHGNSHGLYQIYLKWHPEVSKEQAQDVEFATRWTAKQIQQEQGHLWSCWDKI